MRRAHFQAFAPVCPRCATGARLVLAAIYAEAEDDIVAGLLRCPASPCQFEYPIIDSIPVIVPDLAGLMAGRAAELLLRDDLPEPLESLLGDAIGPDSWFDTLRQTHSTYTWDSYAALDPEEPRLTNRQPDTSRPAERDQAGAPTPGAAARCLAALLALAGHPNPACVLDLGCGAGGSSFALAQSCPDALVLGTDINLGLLRLARRAAAGTVSYPRRRIGLVYDRRCFSVDLPGAARTDFWACDATALPFPSGIAGLTAALNLLDCVPEPSRLLAEMTRILAPGAALLLCTPYDWSTRATTPAHWIGGHSQRAPHAGAAEPFLRSLLSGNPPHGAGQGLMPLGEIDRFPWQTRLHERSAVLYAGHLSAWRRA